MLLDLYPFTIIFVVIIMITNRKTSYRNNRENIIAINDIIEISHRPNVCACEHDIVFMYMYMYVCTCGVGVLMEMLYKKYNIILTKKQYNIINIALMCNH